MNRCAICGSPYILSPAFCYCAVCAHAGGSALIGEALAMLLNAQALYMIAENMPLARASARMIGFVRAPHEPRMVCKIGFMPTTFGNSTQKLNRIGFR